VAGALAGAWLAYGLAPASARGGVSFCLAVRDGLSVGQTFAYEALFALLAVAALVGLFADRRYARLPHTHHAHPSLGVCIASLTERGACGRTLVARWAPTYATVVLTAALAGGAATGGAFNPARRSRPRPPNKIAIACTHRHTERHTHRHINAPTNSVNIHTWLDPCSNSSILST
jgi:glycerol uptake facilitator-like aquaporin